MAKSELDAYAAAKVYWQELDVGTRTYQAVAERLGLGAEKATWDRIGRLVRKWEEDGKVQHKVHGVGPPTGYSPLLPDLEDRLRREFVLRDAIVVDIDDVSQPAGTPQSNRDEWSKFDDTIHQQLGLWASRLLVTLIRAGDIVGTGGGRGPCYTADNCKVPEETTCCPNQIVSLSGAMSTRVWAKHSEVERELDADNVAFSLKRGLKADRPPLLWNRPITDVPTRPSEKKRGNDVLIALTGIGALAGGHRLKRIGSRPELDKVKVTVEELNRLAEEVDPAEEKPPFHHWIADVCNYYFVVNDEHAGAGRSLDSAKRQEIEKQIAELNKAFVNTSPDVLSEICKKGAVVAVAGGPHKASAMRHVLRQSPPWVSHLVTDSKTARALINDSTPS
jgi:DNA-binding transcriptional regulator LsrR (DeoR family)